MTLWKGKNSMGLCMLACGSVFLFLPTVHFYDLFPDVIGYLLIYFGLWRLSDLCDEFLESMRAFRAMLIISAAQIPVQWFLHTYLPNLAKAGGEFNVPTWVLIFSFVWAVLSCMFLIPAYKNLFAGFGVLAIRGEGSVVQSERRTRPFWKRMEQRSVWFAVLLPAVSCLPEFSILVSMNLRSEAPIFTFDWYDYVSMFRTVAAIVGGVIGVLWLISYLRFFVRVMRDKPFCDRLFDRYQAEIAPRRYWLTWRRVTFGSVILTVAMLFAASLRVDSIPVLPGFVCGILTVLGACVLVGRRDRWLWVLSGVGLALTAVSAVHWGLLSAFLEDHKLEEALHFPRAYQKFLVICGLEAAEAILTLLLISVLCVVLWKTLWYFQAEMGCESFQKEKKTYAVKFIALWVLSAIAAMISTVNAFMQLDVSYLWWFALIFAAVAVFVFRSVMLDIRDALYFYARAEKRDE